MSNMVNRKNIVGMRLTDRELRELDKKASKLGISRSELLRLIASREVEISIKETSK